MKKLIVILLLFPFACQAQWLEATMTFMPKTDSSKVIHFRAEVNDNSFCKLETTPFWDNLCSAMKDTNIDLSFGFLHKTGDGEYFWSYCYCNAFITDSTTGYVQKAIIEINNWTPGRLITTVR